MEPKVSILFSILQVRNLRRGNCCWKAQNFLKLKKTKKANKGLIGLTLVRKETHRKGRLAIYHTLIQLHPQQNLLASGRGDIDRLERIQRKGIRIVEGLGRRDNTAQAMKSLRIMPIGKQYKYLNSLWGLRVYTGIALEGVQKPELGAHSEISTSAPT